MSGKRNVSVCRGHELANALYISVNGTFAYKLTCEYMSNVDHNRPGETTQTKHGFGLHIEMGTVNG